MIVTQKKTLYGGVAQLGEHLPCKQGVMGSIPIISTTQQRVGNQNPSGFEVIENRIKRRRVEKTDREDKDLDRVDKIDATRNRSFQSRVKQFHREVEVQSKVKRIRPFYCEKPVFRNSSNSKRKM